MKKIIIIFLILIMIITSYNIITWHLDNSKNERILNDIYLSKEKIESNEKLITTLKKTNNDTKGWIKINGTKVDYPFVQYKDNKYYLTHNFNKEKNAAGWLFLDYRNNFDNLDRNTIIYAHNRKNKSMFGSLKNTLKKDWFNNKEYHTIHMISENYNLKWQIFSIYLIPTTNDYIQIDFEDNNDFNKFINLISNRSIYNFNVPVSINDNILTLSTCNGGNEKLVIHAKLIEKILLK